MRDEDFWKAVQEQELASAGAGRTGALNLALLFGTAVIALALILTPVLSKSDRRMMANIPDDFDMITTGSVPPANGGKRYTIRRSVLQEMPGAVCIVDGSGRSSGC